MKKQLLLLLGAGVAAAGTLVTLKVMMETKKRVESAMERAHIVTVNRPLAEVTLEAEELEPLQNLGDKVEISISSAPDGKGIEIAARLTDTGKASPETLPQLRQALRDTRQLLETGEILSPDKPSTTRMTLMNLPLQFATRHAKEGGRL